jgi:hypothetical protein
MLRRNPRDRLCVLVAPVFTILLIPWQNSIILDPGVSDLLVDDARDFLESKAWYAARGIPFRRGYLLVNILCFFRYFIH